MYSLPITVYRTENDCEIKNLVDRVISHIIINTVLEKKEIISFVAQNIRNRRVDNEICYTRIFFLFLLAYVIQIDI